MIYFDNAATSFYKPKCVKESIINSLNYYTANPGRSGHDLSIKVAEKIYEVREKIKTFFRAENHEVIFTKNCTEALNLAIRGVLKSGDHVITTKYEHNSVLRTLEYMKSQGVQITILDKDLEYVQDELESKISQNTRMVITTHVSNVTGEVCDVDKVGKICKIHNLIYLVDGAQSAGHMKINLDNSNIDMFTFAGHKGLLAMTGVGGLVVKNTIKLNPIMYGGTGTDSQNLVQPNDTIEGFESGTLPTVAIISLGAGIDFINKNFENIIKKEEKLNKYLYKSIKNLKNLKIYSKEGFLNVLSFNVLEYDSSTISNYLNENYKICTRSGLHCSPLIHLSNGTSEIGAVRVSLDFNNSYEEIDYLIKALKDIK